MELKHIRFNRGSIHVPQEWDVRTEEYTESIGKSHAMLSISTSKDDSTSIMLHYSPMPEGSNALVEITKAYENIVGEISPNPMKDPICEYDFRGRRNSPDYGFMFSNEQQHSCLYVCCAVGNDEQLAIGLGCYLLTTLITANSEAECKKLLESIAEDIYLMPPPLKK